MKRIMNNLPKNKELLHTKNSIVLNKNNESIAPNKQTEEGSRQNLGNVTFNFNC